MIDLLIFLLGKDVPQTPKEKEIPKVEISVEDKTVSGELTGAGLIKKTLKIPEVFPGHPF
jgi:hypothetical protein